MAKITAFRTAAQQDLILTRGWFSSELKCHGCGSKSRVKSGLGTDEAVAHASGCWRVPNRTDVADEVESAIITALSRL